MGSDLPVSVVGGAGFRDAVGVISVGWPLVRLVADEVGIGLDVRLAPLKFLLSAFSGSFDPPGPVWFAGWPSLERVERSRHAVVIHRSNGARCRFIAPTRSIDRIESLLVARKVVVRHVVTTVADGFRRG